MRPLLRLAYRLYAWLKESLWVLWLWLPVGRFYKPSRVEPVVAGLTTYPPRIGRAWIAIETLLRQSVAPQALVLVLNDEEFPDHRLPGSIRRQCRRGLTVLWAERNGRSHDKMIPLRQEFPGHTIVTFDDDKFFPRDVLENLVNASADNPGCVIGARGWVIRHTANKDSLRFGEGWTRAVVGERGPHLLTPGGNGCLYPWPAVDPLVDDLDAALALCPTADDIWFWASVQKTHTDLVCLGLPAHKPVSLMKKGPALSALDPEDNNRQFQKALDHFGIREYVTAHAKTPEPAGE